MQKNDVKHYLIDYATDLIKYIVYIIMKRKNLLVEMINSIYYAVLYLFSTDAPPQCIIIEKGVD